MQLISAVRAIHGKAVVYVSVCHYQQISVKLCTEILLEIFNLFVVIICTALFSATMCYMAIKFFVYFSA